MKCPRVSKAEREAHLCAEYAEACRWWAELQEARPDPGGPWPAWLALVRFAYEKVERLAKETGCRPLSLDGS